MTFGRDPFAFPPAGGLPDAVRGLQEAELGGVRAGRRGPAGGPAGPAGPRGEAHGRLQPGGDRDDLDRGHGRGGQVGLSRLLLRGNRAIYETPSINLAMMYD